MQNLSLRKLIICTGISVIISVILLLLITVLVYYGDFEERTVSAVVLLAVAVSVFCGAFILARNIPGGGLLNGLFVGVAYCVVLAVMSFVVNGSVYLDTVNVTKLIIALAGGMLGGVLGINSVA